jgi:hypothetical protein
MRPPITQPGQSERCPVGLAYPLTLLVACALPFEVIHPRLPLGAFEFTSLELLVVLVALARAAELALSAAGGGQVLPMPDALRRWASLLGPIAVFLGAAALSALAAPSHQPDALKFVARFAAGATVCWLVASAASTPARLAGLVWAIVVGAGLSALLGLAEAAGLPGVERLLASFRDAPSRVGGELRVGGTLQYATIGSMFFEVAVPLALAATAAVRSTWWRWLALSCALACTVAVVLSLTRTGLIVLGLLFGLGLGLAWARPGWRPLLKPTALATLVLLASLALGLRSDAFQARMTKEDDRDWYGATYLAPAWLTVRQGEVAAIGVEARNTGRATWNAGGDHPFALSVRWLTHDGLRELRRPHLELTLPNDVAPGETVRLTAVVEAGVPPGDYRIAWDMLQHRILWFRNRGVPEFETLVRVEPGLSREPLAAPATVERDREQAWPAIIPRGELWGAALRMFAERPLFGVGPDNFRHLYGRYLGLADHDPRIHANSLYLELLADLGLVGSAAFGWLLVAVAGRLAGPLRCGSADGRVLWAAGLTGGLLAFLVHGLLDYFLGFTPLYLLFWTLLGLTMALSPPGGQFVGVQEPAPFSLAHTSSRRGGRPR